MVSLSSHPFAVEIADEAYVAGSHFDDQPKRTEPITEWACAFLSLFGPPARVLALYRGEASES